jgi:hypothetical protein
MTRTRTQPPRSEDAPLPIASIVALVGKGMTAREILAVFPELEAGDIRAALLRAAEVMSDEDGSLSNDDAVGRIIRAAQRSSGLSEDEAMALAVSETRAVRRARRRRSSSQ